MQVFLKLGAFDCTPYLREGGLTQGEISRQRREVVTLDGELRRGEVVKRRLSVQLVTLRDTTWYAVCTALRSRPVSVSYVDDERGSTTRQFHVSDKRAGAKTVSGGNTYFSSCSFTLEEA